MNPSTPRRAPLRAALIALAVASAAVGARAEFFTGNDLLDKFRSEALASKGVGLGYVMGVHDALHGVTICTPDHVTSGQLRDMVRNYLDNTPAIRHLSADSIVADVLKRAFPCASRNGRSGSNL